MRFLPRALAPTLLAATLGAAAIGVGPAHAASDLAQTPALSVAVETATKKKPGRLRARIVFQKNKAKPLHSRLIWQVWRWQEVRIPAEASPRWQRVKFRVLAKRARAADRDGRLNQRQLARVIDKLDQPLRVKRWKRIERRSWRAGSGLGAKDPAGTDACVRDHGWAPNGVYAAVQRNHYGGNYIQGDVFYLGAKACRNGTVRKNLFIHTEQNRDSRQCRNLPGDQHCRWEPRFNDYKSNGCIKLRPRDLHQLVRRYHRFFDTFTSYPTRKFAVIVRS